MKLSKFKVEATQKDKWGQQETFIWKERSTLKAAKNLAEKLLKREDVEWVWIERWETEGDLVFQLSKYKGASEWMDMHV